MSAESNTVIGSVTTFIMRVEVPTQEANSVRRYLMTPALGLAANLTEKLHERLDDGGQRITNRRVVWEGKLVGP